MKNHHAEKTKGIDMLDGIERQSSEVSCRRVSKLIGHPSVRAFMDGKRQKHAGDH
jgi:hypothetical protein